MPLPVGGGGGAAHDSAAAAAADAAAVEVATWDSVHAGLTLSCDTFTPFTEPSAEELGRTMRTEMTLPPARLTYHHGTIMRLNDFMFGAMIDAALSSTEVYLGTDSDGTSDLRLHFGALSVALPAAVSSEVAAPAARMSIGEIAISKLHAADGVAPSMGGMLIALSQAVLSAPPDADLGSNLSRILKEADLSGAEGARRRGRRSGVSPPPTLQTKSASLRRRRRCCSRCYGCATSTSGWNTRRRWRAVRRSASPS